MSITNRLTLTKVAAGVVAVAMIVGMLFTFAPAAKAQGLSLSALVELFISLGIIPADKAAAARAALATSGGTTGGGSTSGACPYTWSVNLKVGSTGADVMALQKFLNSMSGSMVAASGAGSPGMETSYYGPATGAAVKKFQEMYKADILTPVGLTTGTTNFFASTRAKANALCVGGTTGGGPVVPAPVPGGTGLAVSAGSQPANALALDNAARIPFTKFMVTAGNDGDVVMNGVTVQRTGLGSNDVFSGIVLLDDMGMQVGISKTLNSDNKATLGEAVTIPRGTTKTFTVAGNMDDDNSARDGQQVRLDVVAVNTSATVTGSLPITGATHTTNASLNIGSVTVNRGALDPGADQSKEAGTTGYNFTSVKFTAGSNEDVYLQSVRFEQTGSAGASDVANVVVVVDGTSYPTVVSQGKYYTATFPGSGLLIAKGFSKDVTLKGDIVGGSNRNLDFDLSKRTDAYFVGKTYGYGIIPPFGADSSGTDDGAFHTTDDPWYDAFQVTVTAGNMVVSVWTSVSAQNIAINQNDQPLGGFSVDVKGEPVTVNRIEFNLYNTDTDAADNALVDNITLVNQNGSVLAGPVDASASFTDAIVFTDSITFPVGVTNLTLKGKLDSTWDANDTLQASTTPSIDFESVSGVNSGKTITPSPASALSSSIMTGKAGTLTVSVSSVPIAQTVIAGAQDFVFANYIIDATASGEDVRMTSLPLAYYTTGTATDVTGCQLWDGTTAVTTGPNIKNPTSVSSSTNFTFDDTGLVVAKGTSKTLALSCDLRTGTTATYYWGLDSAQQTDYTGASGVTSGSTVSETLNEAGGQVMTASSGGSLAAILDTGSPSYKIVAAGATGVELSRIKFTATNEDIDVKQVALQLTSVASNTPVDLVGRTVTLWDGATQVGTAVFPTGDNATSSAITNFRVMKDQSKVLIVKGDIAQISNSGPLTSSGDLLKVDYDGDNSGVNGNYGVGVASGATRTPTSGDTASQGVRIMAAYPVFETVAFTPATLANGSDKVLYRFKVTAVDGDVAIYKYTFNISSTTGPSTATSIATSSSHQLFVFTDSGFSNADNTFGGAQAGLLNVDTPTAVNSGNAGVDLQMLLGTSAGTNRTYVIPSGASRWFELRGTVSGVEQVTGTDTFEVKLLGDANYDVNTTTAMNTASGVDGGTQDDFIWSPVSTTTQSTINDLDFTNGYLVSGLASPSMSSVTHTSTN